MLNQKFNTKAFNFNIKYVRFIILKDTCPYYILNNSFFSEPKKTYNSIKKMPFVEELTARLKIHLQLNSYFFLIPKDWAN